MKLTPDQVRHVAALARIKVSDAEVDKFAMQLTSVLQYVDILNEVDTDGVMPTSQVTGLANVLQEDTVDGFCKNPDRLLKCSNLPVLARQILVKKVFDEIT